ncbi:MAG: DUF882 domain-containing protein [Rhodospirillales bacterium]|nr:DUF882 domain-containing protein [Rhodospirillales bacterium]
MTGYANARPIERRTLLGWLSAGAIALHTRPVWAATETKSLAFRSTHTGETLSCTYWDATGYRGDALSDIDHILRDHRTGDVALMDLGLLDLLHALRTTMESDEPFEVISGYRSPKTNEMLRQKGSGVNENSLHMTGRAIDIRLPGRDTTGLRTAALALRRGGVGYYAKSNFIHVDVGRLQQW